MWKSPSEASFPQAPSPSFSKSFFYKRMHSLLGLWLVIYLCEHLFVNAQAALFLFDRGRRFVDSVNSIHAIPYLKAIEVILLALPFFLHGVWGMYYAWTARCNDSVHRGNKPELPQYRTNRRFSWQRITAWLLVIGILAHVIHMRIVRYPTAVKNGEEKTIVVPLRYDPGLPAAAEALHVQLVQPEASHPPKEWLGVATNRGAATYLVVRQAFKHPLLVLLYSLFVIIASFHACNGLWGLLIKWGILVSRKAHRIAWRFAALLMGVLSCLGLAAIWGTYWVVSLQNTT